MRFKHMIILMLLVTLTPLAWADSLTKKYGERLYSATIDARYAFQRETGIKWDASTKSQRKAFLEKWEERLIQEADKKREARESKQRAAEEKQRALDAIREEKARKQAAREEERNRIANEKAQLKSNRAQRMENYNRKITDLRNGDR